MAVKSEVEHELFFKAVELQNGKSKKVINFIDVVRNSITIICC